MQLSQKALEEFKTIHLEETGEELSDERAFELATHVLRGVELVLAPEAGKP